MLTDVEQTGTVVPPRPTETTDYADLVLPSTMQHEQYEVNDSFAHLYLSLNRPAVDPPGECLPHTEIFRRLARALDLDEPALYASDRELAAALLDTPAYRDADITVDVLEERGWIRVPRTERPYAPFADGFPTPSGRFEIASERAAQDRHGRLPNYRPPIEAGRETIRRDGQPSGGARYDLVAAAGPHHINSVFASTSTVRSRAGRSDLRISPADGAGASLVDGDEVEVGNERGSFRAVVRLDPSVRPGVVAVDKSRPGVSVNATVADRDSDMGRGAVYHDNRVWVRHRGRPGD